MKEKWLDKNISSIKIMGKPLSFYGETKLKYPWSLLKIKNKLLDEYLKKEIKDSAKISENVVVSGPVYIGENVIIKENVVVNGPSYIGNNSIIKSNCVIRKYSNIEKDALIGCHSEIKNSLLLEDVHLHLNYIGDSIIGRGARIGAGTITANTRIDRKEIKKDFKKLGSIIGNNVKIGINCSLMPGILIGKNSIIGSHSLVLKDVGSNILFYNKKEKIKEKIKKN